MLIKIIRLKKFKTLKTLLFLLEFNVFLFSLLQEMLQMFIY